MFSSRIALLALVLGAAALLHGCVRRPVTTLEMSWVTPQLPQPRFNKLLIISVARDDFVQVVFQDQMAAALKAHGINAVASKAYFTISTDAAIERFKRTIDESGADYVLLAYVTGRDATQSRDDQFMTIGDVTGFYTGYDRYLSAARSASDYSRQAMTTEASIYQIQRPVQKQGQRLIWSARIRIENPQVMRGEDYAPQYVAVVLESMKRDKLF